MRLRGYRRKALALALALAAAAACLLALWGGAGPGGAPKAGEPREAAPASQRPAPPPPARLNASSSSSSILSSILPSNESSASSASSLQRLRSLVYRLNFDQPVRNAGLWKARLDEPPGSPSSPPSSSPSPAVVLVVQVHERAEHLRLLLDSLRKAPGVERTLLVLSHDLWSPRLNALAAAVDFCAVLQVFFPFSRQLYPHEFPGEDPRDCPRDLGREEALRRGCLNARFPDAFGHYREAAFAQAKHHWWWKLHFAWERVRVLRETPPGRPLLMLFLEEDHYLAPDFLHVLDRLWALRQRECPDCQLLSLGAYAAPRHPRGQDGDAEAAFAKAELKTWKSTEHNMGMAFARDTYRQLAACAGAFCTYDDYNWDWTLQHLTVACLPRFWKVLVPEVPRVFHTGGDCGMHHRKAACRPAAQAAKVDALLEANRRHLFPRAMAVGKRYALAPLSPHVKNGGWGDIRDHELCKSYQRLQ